MRTGSKFSGIIDAARARVAEEGEEQDQGIKGQERRGGKRNHPDFVQVTAYIPKSVHRATKIELLKEDEPKEFSDLVSELLQEWLKSRT